MVGSGKKYVVNGVKWEEVCWPMVGSGKEDVGRWYELRRKDIASIGKERGREGRREQEGG